MDDQLHMIPYNTGMEKLLLTEYGRHVQNMVEYCVGLEDREERNVCARTIVRIMATLMPDNVGPSGDYKKLWDHLNLMSGFRLDIDFPVEVTSLENLHVKPEKIPYSGNSKAPLTRHYGRNIELIAKKIADMPEGPDKDAAISMVAHHMKKLLMLNNKQGVSDARVLHDLAQFTEGRINLDPSTYILHEFFEMKPQVPKAKKLKKRK